MQNELDWAEIRCSKYVTSESSGKQLRITNTYMIAFDVRDLSEEFTCPCCGKELRYEVAFKGNLSKEQKNGIVRDSRSEGLRYLKAFKILTAAIAAAAVLGLLLNGSLFFGAAGIVFLLFLFVWLPGLFLLIGRYMVLRSRNSIIDEYEKQNPVTVTLTEDDASLHRFEDFPDVMVRDDPEANYGLE